MPRAMRFLLLLLATLAALPAASPDRTVAEWTLLHGGRVGLNGSPRPVTDIVQLPAGDFQLTLLDWVAVNAVPEDLARLEGISHLRELRLPGPIWNRNADGGKNLSQELRHLARLGNLQRITFSDHFLDRIRFTDDGLLAIGGLDNLRELALRQAEVTGKGLKPFHLLEALDITLCPIDDAGFAHLAAMKQLRRLRAGNTLISSNALASLAPLTLLEELDLSGTAIDDAAIPHLAPLAHLRRLDLAGANITDAALETIARLPALEELNLYRTKVTNTGLARLRSLASLRDLDVRYSRATAAGVAALARPGLAIAFSASPSLRAPAPPPRQDGQSTDNLLSWIRSLGGELSAEQTRLSLRGTAINDATAAALAPLGSALRHLDLSATEIGDAGLAVLAHFPRLESLNLGNTAVSSSGLAKLPRSLQKLVLDNTYCEGAGLPPLPALAELDLLGAPVSDAGLQAIVHAAPNLRRLHLAETDITSEGLAALARLVRLEHLDLAATDIDDAALPHLQPLQQLAFLRLRETRITDKGLAPLAALTRLQSLDLGRTRLTNAGMVPLASLKRLAHLNLEYTDIDDAGLLTLANALPSLRDLNLDSTNISDASAPALARLGALERLNLYHTLLSSSALEKLTPALPQCRIIWDPDSSRNNRRRA
jgi:Leucine-rich repeat (LRR) protein